jgi:hypothetical protein
MAYFAGLDISMDDTSTFSIAKELLSKRKTTPTAQTIADELAKAPE